MSETAMKDLIDLFRKELDLCQVGSGQTVVVLSEGDVGRDYAEASVAAATDLGASVTDLNLPSKNRGDASERIADLGKNALANRPDAMKACKEADMVIDHMLLLFSKEQIEIQQAGTRMLLVVEPFEVLQRLFPTEEIRQRVEVSQGRLERAHELRFTNSAGTDVTYALGDEFPVLTEYGYTATPGRWDHWPGGFLATLASNRNVNGRVVMTKRDILYPQKQFLKDDVEFTVRDGFVTEIRGGADAALVREFMESYNDPRAYAVSHIGWGLNHLCQWEVDLPGIGMDGRAYYGNVLFSLGPDTEFGGDNDTACHMDLPMRDCTLYLDDDLILENGEFVPEDLRAPGH